MTQDTAIQWIGYLTMALVVLVPAGAVFWKMLRKDKAEADRALFLQGVHIAYGVVNNIAAMTDNKIDDKAAEFLKQLKTYLEPKGVEVTPVVAAEAQMIANAIHGNEKKVLEAATSDAKADPSPH